MLPFCLFILQARCVIQQCKSLVPVIDSDHQVEINFLVLPDSRLSIIVQERGDHLASGAVHSMLEEILVSYI